MSLFGPHSVICIVFIAEIRIIIIIFSLPHVQTGQNNNVCEVSSKTFLREDIFMHISNIKVKIYNGIVECSEFSSKIQYFFYT